MFSAVIEKFTSLKSRTPILKKIHFNFISIHYAYIISCAIICSIIIYPGGELRYIDALFHAAGAATQSGLNTVDLNLLHTYQQVFLWFFTMICNPIFIHTFVVFVRLYWFEKRFQHVVQDARAMRRTRSRARTFTTGRDEYDANQEEMGVRGRSIVVLRDNAGEARRGVQHHEVAKPEPESTSETDSSHAKEDTTPSVDGTDGDTGSTLGPGPRRLSLRGMRLPTQLSPEHHIAFLERQRRDKGALRIPSPREYDRGGMPQALDEEGGDLDRTDTRQSERRQRLRDSAQGDTAAPSVGQHITINEPELLRSRSRTTTLPRMDGRRSATEGQDGGEPSTWQRSRARRSTLNTLLRSLTEEKEKQTLPYLSWNATVGRNSNFVNLTEEQRDELGGIEYRALKTLALVLITYFFFFHVLGIICLVPWIMHAGQKYRNVLREGGIGRPWWGIFTAGSAFNDLGFTLTPDSMNSFNDAIFPLLLMSFLIIIGNTGFPCLLRLIIWVLSKITTKGSPLWEELQFLLDHPRRCFTLLFPRNATWWLFAILVILNGVDLIFFIILDLNDPDVTSIPPGIRVLDGWFQATSTRTAGFSVISLSNLHPAIQVSYLIMMYISVFPIAISMRRTNVYEEKSLGIYSSADDDEEETPENTKEPSYIATHLRKQLSFDLWYVFLGLFIISIVEGSRLENTNEYAFTLFSVLFEIISAYGTVGLSLGYPNVNASFSSQFKTLSKLVIIAMQIRGRHRGLPYALDRAILLPSESLHKKEIADAERRMRRRTSNLSNMSTVTSQPPPGFFRSEAGMTTGRDTGTQPQGFFRSDTAMSPKDTGLQPRENGETIEPSVTRRSPTS